MEQASKDVQVRRAEPGDADAVDRLILHLDEFHAQARPDLFQVPSQKPRGDSFLQTAIDDAQQNVLVATMAADVVGYVHVIIRQTAASDNRVERRYAEIDTIAVAPAMQRLGTGRKLIEAALHWAECNGVNDHQIGVHEFNWHARRLYEQLGFLPSVTLMRRKR